MTIREVKSMADALDANPVVIDMLEVAKEAERAGGKGIADSLRDGVDEIERLENLSAFYKRKLDRLFDDYSMLQKQYAALMTAKTEKAGRHGGGK